jgi:hypothetical protein
MIDSCYKSFRCESETKRIRLTLDLSDAELPGEFRIVLRHPQCKGISSISSNGFVTRINHETVVQTCYKETTELVCGYE